ncbi:MAG: galactokinase [Tissierellia bacterium]|nr:galactokinase [Tissierellia bacterium]
MDNLLKSLTNTFRETFQREPEGFYFSPSRINVIGEHIDYNGGSVLPFAISLGTYGLVAPWDDYDFISLNVPGRVKTKKDHVNYNETFGWGNYPLGMIKAFQKAGYETPGFQGLFFGNIPNGAGLSSSASLEILTGEILKNLAQKGPDKVEMALLGQKVENEHFGLQSGIMDQFIISMGKKDHGILLQTKDLSYKYLPMVMDHYIFVIMNTGVRRELVSGEYNSRREDCENALATLQKYFSIDYLCDLEMDNLDKALSLLSSPKEKKRVHHVITENHRVKKGVEALESKNFIALGEILNASHMSLKTDYEVTGFELDTITEIARKHPSCLGARMTGAGFSGCAIALVETTMVEEFISYVRKEYKNKTGQDGEFYKALPGDGARKLY